MTTSIDHDFLEMIQEYRRMEIKFNYAILDVDKRYRFIIENINTNEIIIIDEDTERKAFRKASRFLGEKKVMDMELHIIDKKLKRHDKI